MSDVEALNRQTNGETNWPSGLGRWLKTPVLAAAAVKGVYLRSIGRLAAWVQTPQVAVSRLTCLPPNLAKSVFFEHSAQRLDILPLLRENYLWLRASRDIIELGTSKQPSQVPLNNSSQRK